MSLPPSPARRKNQAEEDVGDSGVTRPTRGQLSVRAPLLPHPATCTMPPGPGPRAPAPPASARSQEVSWP